MEDRGIGFSGCTVPPDNKETELKNSNQEASLSGLSLQLFVVVWIFLRFLGIIFYDIKFSVKVTKISSRLGFSAYLSDFYKS